MSNSDRDPNWALYYGIILGLSFALFCVILFLLPGPHLTILGLVGLAALVAFSITIVWWVLRTVLVRTTRKGTGRE